MLGCILTCGRLAEPSLMHMVFIRNSLNGLVVAPSLLGLEGYGTPDVSHSGEDIRNSLWICIVTASRRLAVSVRSIFDAFTRLPLCAFAHNVVTTAGTQIHVSG
jgi:hypothetical protein